MLGFYVVLAVAARLYRAGFNTSFLEMIIEDIIGERLIASNILRRPKRCVVQHISNCSIASAILLDSTTALTDYHEVVSIIWNTS